MKYPKRWGRVAVLLIALSFAGLAGCRNSSWTRGRWLDSPPGSSSEEEEFAEVVPAGFERPLAPGGYQPGGYLQESPGFPAGGPGGWWAVHAAEMDALKSKNQELEQRQETLIAKLEESRQDLVETRESLLASEEESRIARRELTAAREDLLQWQEQTEATLRRYHQVEREHLAELDAMLVLLQDFLQEPAKD